jgi:hypothetical protein
MLSALDACGVSHLNGDTQSLPKERHRSRFARYNSNSATKILKKCSCFIANWTESFDGDRHELIMRKQICIFVIFLCSALLATCPGPVNVLSDPMLLSMNT